MKYNIWHFFLFLFTLNLIQSLLTPIARDEAYFWMFGQNLDWGYFDHPPMVTLMTFIGNLFFEGELGVYLITCFMVVGLAYFICMMIPQDVRQKVQIKILKANSPQTFSAFFKSVSVPGIYTIGTAIRPSKLFPISVSKRTYLIEVLAH